MNYENNLERTRIINSALAAHTLPEIVEAAQALRHWIQQHPDDLNAEDALEPLAMLRKGFEAEIAQGGNHPHVSNRRSASKAKLLSS